jgi:transcriptional regulator with XRE-family HTH domain
MTQTIETLNRTKDLHEWLSRYPDYKDQIKILRQTRGMTQEQLAKQVKRTPRSIRMIENGEAYPRLTTLQKIAAALKADMIISLIPGTGAPQFLEEIPPGKIDSLESPYSPMVSSDILVGETD